MQAVFFEMRPLAGHLHHYFDHVARLKPVLAAHRGLAFLDRYSSLTDPDVLLSHQLWESEAAIAAWRLDAEHRRSQTAGREQHFADYRIRVGERVMYWKAGDAAVAPPATSAGNEQHVVALYGLRSIVAPFFTAFESVNHQARFISIATMTGSSSALDAFLDLLGVDGLEAAAVYAIARDYGQFNRAQAPR